MNKQQKNNLMGKRVRVLEILAPHKEWCRDNNYSRIKRTLIPTACDKVGWITGFSTRYEGDIDYLGSDEGTAFIQTACVPVVLVRFTPRSREVAVQYDGFEVIEGGGTN